MIVGSIGLVTMPPFYTFYAAKCRTRKSIPIIHYFKDGVADPSRILSFSIPEKGFALYY